MAEHGWRLEVVRGAEVGRAFALGHAQTVLGNSPGEGSVINLSGQEGTSPRRMAARQASVEISPNAVLLRDLDSPGGTFVNRQRVLPGQAIALKSDDVIQLGGVQLKLVEATPTRSAVPPSSSGKTTSTPQRPAQQAAAKAVPIAHAPPTSSSARNVGNSSGPAAQPARRTTSPTRPSMSQGQGERTNAAKRSDAAARPVPPTPPTPVAAPASKASVPPALPVPFVLREGGTCRTWDDFLTVSAQNWSGMTDELVSGRLAAYLAGNRLAHLAPSPSEPGTPNERLDTWLRAIPSRRASAPELDVHPASLTVRVSGGGGTTRQLLTLSNVGYRLLRTRIEIDPQSSSWIRLAPGFRDQPIVTVDRTDVQLEVESPESLEAPRVGSITLRSNGGERVVPVRLERAPALESIPGLSTAFEGGASADLNELLGRHSPVVRLFCGVVAGVAARLLLGVGSLLWIGGKVSAEMSPLLGPLVLFGALGAFGGLALASKRAKPLDLPFVGIAGVCVGVLFSLFVVALARSLEWTSGPDGSASPSLLSLGLLWSLIGGVVAGFSLFFSPYQPPLGSEETSQ